MALRSSEHKEYMGSVKLIDSAEPFEVSSAFPAEAIPKSRERFEIATAFIERIADVAAVMAATTLAYETYELLRVGKQLHYSTAAVLLAGFGLSVLFVSMLDHDGTYKRANSLLRIRETERILRVTMQAFGLVFPVTFFFLHPFSRWIVLLAVVFVPLLVIVEKQLVFVLIRNLHSRGFGLQNVLIYGAGLTGRRVFSAIIRSPKLGLNPVAIVDEIGRAH